MSSSSSETKADQADQPETPDDAPEVTTPDAGEPERDAPDSDSPPGTEPEGDDAAAVLTDAEIEALREEPSPEDTGPLPFDFSKPRVLRRTQHEGLSETFERAAKLVAPFLRHEMRAEVTVDYRGGQAFPFEEFLGNLESPFNLYAVGYRGMEVHALVSLDPGLAFSFVEALLGGSGSEAGTERSLTATESAVASKLIDGILERIHEALQPAVQVRFWLDRFLNRRNQFDLLKPPAMVYSADFEVNWGELTGTIRYVMPLKVLRPIVQSLGPDAPTETQPAKKGVSLGKVGRAFLHVHLELVAQVSGPPLSFRSLSGLQVGDVLPLGRSADQTVRVRVEGMPKILGTLGVHEGSYAVVVRGWNRAENPDR